MSVENLERITRHRGKPILIDTNILLLYFVGGYDRTLIGRFKRTKAYTPDDYDLLLRVVPLFRNILVTPNILTELSNLAGQLDKGTAIDFFERFADEVQTVDERYVESIEAAGHVRFPRLGLTDATIHLLAAERILVLTDDLRLAGTLEADGFDVINFNHLRWMNWGH